MQKCKFHSGNYNLSRNPRVSQVLFMGESAFILNSITSTFGELLFYLPRLSFYTDAYELLGLAQRPKDQELRQDFGYSQRPCDAIVRPYS